MTQHDYVIENQTAPSFREDLNNALEAIASTNSGPTAPTFEQTFPGMLWYYTGNTDLVVGTQTIPRNSLNIRSEANDLWYPIGRVSTTNDQFSLFQGSNVVTNGGATIVGVIDVQDQATWDAGISTTETLISPAKLAAAVGGTSPISKEYISPSKTLISGGVITLTHGLGEIPKIIQYLGVCTVAQNGYAIGDIVDLTNYVARGTGGTVANGLASKLSTTTIEIRVGSSSALYYGINFSSGGSGGLSVPNWDLIVKAWA
jgi:hypothetical protein